MSGTQSAIDDERVFEIALRETGSEYRARALEQRGAWNETLEDAIYGDRAWTVPGMGEQPASCGRYFPREFCNTCGEPHFGASRCLNRSCPDCWWKWSRDGAARITRRIGAYRHVQRAAAGKRTVHVQVSPPPGTVQSIDECYRAFQEGYKIAREHGVLGGAAIFHAYRVEAHAKDSFRTAKEEGQIEAQTGIWRWIRENDVHWRDQVYWSPHIHVIGVADPESKDPETGRGGHIIPGDDLDDDGWVFTNIRSLDRFQLNQREGYDDMIGLARYLLSHASFEAEESKQAVRWFGSLSPSSFSPEDALTVTAYRRLEEQIEELIGSRFDEDGELVDEDEEDVCRRDECGGELLPIWEAGVALQEQRFCKMIGRDQERRLVAAFKWMLGERKPPPGIRFPRSIEDAHTALELML